MNPCEIAPHHIHGNDKRPQFLAEAAGQKLDIEAMSGLDMAAYLNRLYTTPAALLKRAIDIMAQAQKDAGLRSELATRADKHSE